MRYLILFLLALGCGPKVEDPVKCVWTGYLLRSDMGTRPVVDFYLPCAQVRYQSGKRDYPVCFFETRNAFHWLEKFHPNASNCPEE